jgi:hypothetical protein
MMEARAAGGKAGRLAAVKIQSVWRGHWLRVKKVCVCFCVMALLDGAASCDDFACRSVRFSRLE